MDQVKKLRRPVRALLSKRLNELDQELSADSPNKDEVRVMLEMLEKTFEKLDDLDQRVMVYDMSDEDQDSELAAAADYEKRYRLTKLKCCNFLVGCGPVGSASSDAPVPTGTVATPSHSYKLPKIEIKKFNGELKEWLGFWSQFEKIHNDSKLHDSDKFQYLVQSMVPGTRADKLVNSYPQSASNYPLAVAALKDRFGDQVLLTEVYVRQLLKLVIRNAGVGKQQNLSLSAMYDELESNLRALETLGVTQEQSAAFLYPLVESSLPVEIIQVWQRSAVSGYEDDDAGKPADERLKTLMKFLRGEVRGAERLSYVTAGFSELKVENTAKPQKDKRIDRNIASASAPTAAGLFSGHAKTTLCIFCDHKHDSEKCVTAQTMPFDVKKRKVLDKKACLACLKVGHVTKVCKSYVKCLLCQNKHVTLMCPELGPDKRLSETKQKSKADEQPTFVHSQLNCTNAVMLQTLCCIVRVGESHREVRILLDPGSQKSYILEKTAKQLGAKPSGETKLCHLLFGGIKDVQNHSVYNIQIESRQAHAVVKLLGHQKICHKLPRMPKGPWLSELKEKGIFVSDVGSNEAEIEVLIGADYYASWLTGRKQCLNNGLVALETCFGWTVSGKLKEEEDDPPGSAVALHVMSMFVAEARVADLWSLETIGIDDPCSVKSRDEREKEVKEHFLQTVTRSPEGQYCVCLPWVDERPKIPNNKAVAEKRLRSMTDKLVKQGRYDEYHKVFRDWLDEGLIELVNDDVGGVDQKPVYYLPHRAVFKPDSKTTPVRPVFDASCKSGLRSPSLNDLLEKGPNLMELLPTILLRFRENVIGVSSDIRKAFQMIDVAEPDRDFLRFLWWEDNQQKVIKTYRHKRVVFGVNCSPFLLAAVLDLHLKSVTDDRSTTATKLLLSLYVDNCAASVNTNDEFERFKNEATLILSEAKMHLRNWECTLSPVKNLECDAETLGQEQSITKVLGLIWDKTSDQLSCEIPTSTTGEIVTKRTILSHVNQVFDPVGFLGPALLPLKLMLQDSWSAKLGWDDELSTEASAQFRRWLSVSSSLQDVKISRSITNGFLPAESRSELHTFCDASQYAYAAVVYLRTEITDHNEVSDQPVVSVQLLMAKTRLAPLNKSTIPRLELLACTIGARLTNFVREALNLKESPNYLWTDSTTALAWIKRNDDWGTFVGNRVREICTLTKPEDWRHVPGSCNPADLPSRGCSPSELLQSKWWEGPQWLLSQRDQWPIEQTIDDETVILSERKQPSRKSKPNAASAVAALLNESVTLEKNWYCRLSSYIKNVRVIAWLGRFVHNARHRTNKRTGDVTVEEFSKSETLLLRIVQSEQFAEQNGSINGLQVEKGSDGLFHVKTRLTYRDGDDFAFPVLLPFDNPLTEQLISSYHRTNHHAGTQFLISKMRERFWIPRARKTINRVVRRCKRCLRHNSQSFRTEPAALPPSRTETSNKVFQCTGVDLAGPLVLKGGEKAWIVLFTCAVYRCIHLDFVTSLSTDAFLNAFERFINIRGRPSVMYSDNGTNFVGAVNLFDKLNWKTIEQSANVKRIKWVFNPPSAAWWGGWWERLIRTVKDLLKRMLGNARLNYEQLRTSLSHVENIVNERPLTALTEDQNDLVPLTPAMFLRGIDQASFPEGQLLGSSLCESYERRQSLQQELKQRFRKEYLSQLVMKAKEQPDIKPNVGDIVLVGSDDVKRIQWPMAKIIELIPGRDSIVRTARVKTQNGVLLRPIQRLHPLELSTVEKSDLLTNKLSEIVPAVPIMAIDTQPERDHDSEHAESSRPTHLITRSGRKINKPKRLID